MTTNKSREDGDEDQCESEFLAFSLLSGYEAHVDDDGGNNEDNEEMMKSATINARRNFGCRHVPHASKPLHVVERRNARERRRVQAVNSAFARLRRAVPSDNRRGKRMSKVRVLQRAIDYIRGLEQLVAEADGLAQDCCNDQVMNGYCDDDHLFDF